MSKKPRTLSDAIEKLENTTTETAGDIKRLVGQNLDEVLQALEDLQPQVKDQIKELRGQLAEEVTARKNQVEKKVKDNPWLALGVVGVLAFILGWIFAGFIKDNGKSE